ncbi:MAG: hypothetical protein IJB24_08200 [Clostridia bacterium]|nr:hypothetical protein [Clostridia bacterium]MBQ4602827.1 hypothetical protein [Clostridia bacterium]
MKKIIFVFLLLSILLLCSCRSAYNTAFEVMQRLEAPNGAIYKNDTDISESEYISSEELGYLYYGESAPLAELDYLESYCIYMSYCKAISEIHIFETKYQSDVEALKRMLQSRADFLSELRINPNSSDFFCDTKADCEIFSKGRFVFLVVGNTEEKIKNIEKLF